MLDCACFAGIVALKHFRRPEVEVIGDEVIVVSLIRAILLSVLFLADPLQQHAPTERAPVPLSIHHTPFCFTFAFFALSPSSQSIPITVLDPAHLEQRLSTGSLSIALNAQREVCVLQKLGGVPLGAEEVVGVVQVAVGKAKETERLVEAALREDWEGRKGDVEVR